MTDSTADQTPENIAGSAVVGKKLRLITDQHNRCAQVIREDSHGSCLRLVLFIVHTGQLFDSADDRDKNVGSVDIFCSVQECKNPFQSPSGINILLLQRCEGPVMMLLVLHENVIAELRIFAAVTSRAAVRAAVRHIRDIEHLAVRTAGAVFKSPPVIFRGKIENTVLPEAGGNPVLRAFLITGCVFIAGKNRRGQMIRIKAKHFRQQLKAPLAAFFLKIIAQAPASHHLEEGDVALVADGFNIIGSNTSLHIAEPCAERMLFAEQIRHQRLHAGDIEQYACRSVGDQRHGAAVRVTALFVEIDPRFSEFLRSKLSHNNQNLPFCLLFPGSAQKSNLSRNH